MYQCDFMGFQMLILHHMFILEQWVYASEQKDKAEEGSKEAVMAYNLQHKMRGDKKTCLKTI